MTRTLKECQALTQHKKIGALNILTMYAMDSDHVSKILYPTVKQIGSFYYVDWTNNVVIWAFMDVKPALPFIEKI